MEAEQGDALADNAGTVRRAAVMLVDLGENPACVQVSCEGCHLDLPLSLNFLISKVGMMTQNSEY